MGYFSATFYDFWVVWKSGIDPRNERDPLWMEEMMIDGHMGV